MKVICVSVSNHDHVKVELTQISQKKTTTNLSTNFWPGLKCGNRAFKVHLPSQSVLIWLSLQS